MYRESEGVTPRERAQPMPPVRTRWRSPETPMNRGGVMLGPVRSGRFGTGRDEVVPPVEPPAEPAAFEAATEPAAFEAATEPAPFEAAAEPTPAFAEPLASLPELTEPETAEAAAEPATTSFETTEPAMMLDGALTFESEPEEAAAHAEDDGGTAFGLPTLEEPEAEDAPAMAASLDAWGDPDASPWAEAEDEDGGVVYEIEVESAEIELEMEEGAGDDGWLIQAGELTLDPALPDADAALDPAERAAALGDLAEAEDALEPRPAPISAWDLAPLDPEEAARQDRARQEWESFGKALVESLGGTGGLLELAAELRESTAEAGVEQDSAIEGLEPLSAGFDREKSETAAPAGLDELAERLERFAAMIRTEGRGAITRAQYSDDRLEALLSGFAAGWLAARGE